MKNIRVYESERVDSKKRADDLTIKALAQFKVDQINTFRAADIKNAVDDMSSEDECRHATGDLDTINRVRSGLILKQFLKAGILVQTGRVYSYVDGMFVVSNPPYMIDRVEEFATEKRAIIKKRAKKRAKKLVTGFTEPQIPVIEVGHHTSTAYDLHGYHVPEARQALKTLIGYMLQTISRNTIVKVMVGKGTGTLKRVVGQWLRQHNLKSTYLPKYSTFVITLKP